MLYEQLANKIECINTNHPIQILSFNVLSVMRGQETVMFPCSLRSRELAPTDTPNTPLTSFHPPAPLFSVSSQMLRSRAVKSNSTSFEAPVRPTHSNLN
jgi:hypothetical protein